MLIRRASLLSGDVVDIRLGEVITEMADVLQPAGDEFVVDAAGGLVIPGLHDHHVHVRSAAAAMGSVVVGPPQVRDDVAFAAAIRAAVPDDDGWIRAVGYHDSVAGPLTRTALDELSPVVPLRVQHRSGAMWILNSAALERAGLTGHADGRLVRTEVSPALGHQPPSLRALSETLLRHGVTGVTDATPDQRADDIAGLAEAHRRGDFAPRLHCMAPPDVHVVAGATVGPAKRILDDGTLDLDALEHWIRHCHNADRAVAVHCVTVAQLVVTIAALRGAGTHPGDRIEHAAVVPADCVADLVELGVTVVTQPNFVSERGDEYLADVPADEHDQLWRIATLIEAGVPVALSTDVPFGAADPWAAMRAAVHRITPSGAVIGPAECISPRAALDRFLGSPDAPAVPRRVEIGARADLCILAAPVDVVLAELDSRLVSGTVFGGDIQVTSEMRS
jgi:predicted amidohydrolase YtcJ